MKNNFKRIISMMLVCMTLIGMMAGFSVSAEAADPTIEIVSNNVRYGDTLNLMYAVKATNLPEGATIEVTITDKDGNVCKTVADGTVTINGEECYKFISKRGVPLQNIDEVLTATATIVGTDISDTQDYSVLQYLWERLYVSTGVTAEQTALYNALLTYAKAADVVLNEEAVSSIESLTYVLVNGEGAMYKIGEVIELTTDLEAGAGEEIAWFVGETRLTEEEVLAGYTVTAAFATITAQIVEGGTVAEPAWRLVTDLSQLSEGAQIVIVAKDYKFAISTTQNKNNRGQAAYTKNDDGTITFGSDVQILTLTAGTKADTWGFYTGSGYLYAASSGSNHLKTQTTNSDNGSWSISVAADGTATVKAQGSYTRNVMQYNQSSSLFACYASATQKAICIYVYA